MRLERARVFTAVNATAESHVMRAAPFIGRASGVGHGLLVVLACAAMLAALLPARAEGAKLPNDPLIGRQWELASGASMHAPSAWDRVVGGPVTVAVIDSGLDLTHPDLAGN